ncbi:MAG: Clp protease N-terminal domain-containing protein [Deltaproteobacteria bacterium]|nr:Clp protease N-terminal domain-containing protein [Deltaproteobacteria bacterium]
MIDLGNYKDYFSEKVGEILNQAVEESKKRQHGNLGVEHLFIAFSRVEDTFFKEVMSELAFPCFFSGIPWSRDASYF